MAMKMTFSNLRLMRVSLKFAFPMCYCFSIIAVGADFFLSTEQVIEGLDRTVMTMKKGEVASVIIAPEYAFGFSESKQELAVVPANSTVFYEVELVSFIKVSRMLFILVLLNSFKSLNKF